MNFRQIDYEVGIGDLFKRVSKIKLLILLIVTVINSFISISFVAITTFASNLNNNSNINDILVFASKGIGMYMLVFLAMYFCEVLINDILRDLSVSFIKDISEKFYYEYGGNTDEATSLINQDTEMIIDEFYMPLLSIPTYFFRTVIPIIYLLNQNFIVGLLFTIGSFLMLLPQYIGKKKISRLGKIYSDTREKSLSTLIDVFKGKNMIKNNQAEVFYLNKLSNDFSNKELSHNKLKNFRALVFCLSGPLKGVADVIPFAIGIYLMRYNTTISLVMLMAMLATAGNLKQQFQQIIYLTGDMLGTPEVRKKIGLIINKNKDNSSKKLIKINDIKYFCIKNLSKSYGKKNIFNNFSIDINKGEKLLLIGQSGVGKSTLFKILMGQEKFDSGEFYILDSGNNKVPTYGNISIVDQNPYLINASIRENLCLGNKYNDDDLIEILKKVKLFVELGNKPLDVLIEKNGENISIGQKMRLELARSLLRNTPIILIDELSSNLDKETGFLMKNIIMNSDKTVIEIAHHFSNLDQYDRVLEIVDKKIVRKVNI